MVYGIFNCPNICARVTNQSIFINFNISSYPEIQTLNLGAHFEVHFGVHFEAHFGQVPDKWEMSRSAAALFCMYATVYLTSVEHGDILAECAEWHSFCFMGQYSLKTTKI